MIVYKTQAGREALNVRGVSLTGRQRQAIILANGQRSGEELARMLGEDGAMVVIELVNQGHLSWMPTEVVDGDSASPEAYGEVIHRQIQPLSLHAYA